MHRLCLEWISHTKEYQHVIKVTKRQYEHIFSTKFKMSFHKPKDLCEKCTICRNADNKRKEVLKDAYEKQNDKQKARQANERRRKTGIR